MFDRMQPEQRKQAIAQYVKITEQVDPVEGIVRLRAE